LHKTRKIRESNNRADGGWRYSSSKYVSPVQGFSGSKTVEQVCGAAIIAIMGTDVADRTEFDLARPDGVG
jgi:hypothetical protein